jgi:hypothetical protein
LAEKALIRVCSLANKEHAKSRRQYAHTFHFPMVICVADAFEELPLGYRLGILLHECGHLYLGRDVESERAADEIIDRIYGVRLQRRTYNGARRLECVALKDYGNARRILRAVTR